VPYVDAHSGELLRDFGRCDRQNSCGYNHHPSSDPEFKTKNIEAAPPPPRKFVEKDVMISTMTHYGFNNLYNYLVELFGEDKTDEVFERYCVGSAKNNAAIYWYINFGRKIVNGKIIRYNVDGHRDKSLSVPYYLYKASEGYGQCFFGEHLLSLDEGKKPVAMVESEKSAIFGALMEPEYIWLGCGGANGLTDEKIKVLKGRDVSLLPDCDNAGREAFGKKLIEIQKIAPNSRIVDLDQSLDGGEDYADLSEKRILANKITKTE